MKKLEMNQIENLKGQGCGKWERRINRAVRKEASREVVDSLVYAYLNCLGVY